MRATIPAAVAACIAAPAEGQERYGAPPNTSADAGIHVTLEAEADEAGRLGQIVHHNRFTVPPFGSDFFEFETSRGLVIVHLEVTPNGDCPGPNGHGCPDTLTIWKLPEGVMASMLESETPERETVVIDLFEWSGM